MSILGDDGIFGKMFDSNGDGKLDCFEQAMESMFLDELLSEEAEEDLDE